MDARKNFIFSNFDKSTLVLITAHCPGRFLFYLGVLLPLLISKLGKKNLLIFVYNVMAYTTCFMFSFDAKNYLKYIKVMIHRFLSHILFSNKEKEISKHCINTKNTWIGKFNVYTDPAMKHE